MSNCEHEWNFKVDVFNFEDKPGNASLELSGVCKRCALPMVFHGQRGASAPFPVVSVDRLELRIPVTIGYQAKFKPGPAVLLHGNEVVPTEGLQS